jgi:predicted glycogen debranching enzyme
MIRGRSIIVPTDPTADASAEALQLRSREWLVTNGLGGYASSTLAGIPARKYHGLFVPNLAAPKGRHVLLSRVDEQVLAADLNAHLGGGVFNDRVSGDVHRYLKEFRLDHRIAVWVFELNGLLLEKSLVMPHHQNTVCVHYRLLRGTALELRVRPFVTCRRQDQAPSAAPTTFTLHVTRGRHEIRFPEAPVVLRLDMQPAPAVFTTDGSEECELLHHIDRERGEIHAETACSPGYFSVQLTPERPASFIASTQSWESLQLDAATVLEAERKRLDTLLTLAPVLHGDEFAEQLAMAADQFVVLPGSRLEESVLAQAEGGEVRTVFAGYHWFADWGRDTMISLEGLTLCTGRFREAGATLRTFANYVKDGLLPNLFPEGERQALYHTVDATLWYFHAISRYIEVTGDRAILQQLQPVLTSIIDHHLNGTHFGIHADPRDGLISAAAEGYQLTWMDAKVDGWVVTPRRGKPVEIQALWYNALILMSEWAAELRGPHDRYARVAAQARESFNQRFWNATEGCLFDVLDGPGGNDASIRPNQIFAISLTHPVLEQRHWQTVLEVVRRTLLTRVGLRTLAPSHPDYKSHYRGDLHARDAAYHQGTVWPWLIGHFIDASLKVEPQPHAARRLLEGFAAHLTEAGIGSISEIFDAEDPHAPGGCIAQAWSVAEVLRAWLKTRTL